MLVICLNSKPCLVVAITLKRLIHEMLFPGVISRGGSGARSPLVKISAHFGGLSPPQNPCIGLAFQSLLALLPKCYDQLCTAIWLLTHLFLLVIIYQY